MNHDRRDCGGRLLTFARPNSQKDVGFRVGEATRATASSFCRCCRTVSRIPGVINVTSREVETVLNILSALKKKKKTSSNVRDSQFVDILDCKGGVKRKNKNANSPKPVGLKGSHSLLLLDLHGEAFHVGVFKVEAEVLPAEAQVGRHAVRRQSGGLGRRDGRKRLGGGGEQQ